MCKHWTENGIKLVKLPAFYVVRLKFLLYRAIMFNIKYFPCQRKANETVLKQGKRREYW